MKSKILGNSLFQLGFIIEIGIVIAYIILMIIGVKAFETWVTALSMCGITLFGALLMLWGRHIEKKESN